MAALARLLLLIVIVSGSLHSVEVSIEVEQQKLSILNSLNVGGGAVDGGGGQPAGRGRA